MRTATWRSTRTQLQVHGLHLVEPAVIGLQHLGTQFVKDPRSCHDVAAVQLVDRSTQLGHRLAVARSSQSIQQHVFRVRQPVRAVHIVRYLEHGVEVALIGVQRQHGSHADSSRQHAMALHLVQRTSDTASVASMAVQLEQQLERRSVRRNTRLLHVVQQIKHDSGTASASLVVVLLLLLLLLLLGILLSVESMLLDVVSQHNVE